MFKDYEFRNRIHDFADALNYLRTEALTGPINISNIDLPDKEYSNITCPQYIHFTGVRIKNFKMKQINVPKIIFENIVLEGVFEFDELVGSTDFHFNGCTLGNNFTLIINSVSANNSVKILSNSIGYRNNDAILCFKISNCKIDGYSFERIFTEKTFEKVTVSQSIDNIFASKKSIILSEVQILKSNTIQAATILIKDSTFQESTQILTIVTNGVSINIENSQFDHIMMSKDFNSVLFDKKSDFKKMELRAFRADVFTLSNAKKSESELEISGGTNFKKISICDARFKKIKFTPSLEKSFNAEVVIQGVEVCELLDFSRFVFSSAILIDKCDIEKIKAHHSIFSSRLAIINSTLKKAPEFFSADIFPDVTFENSQFLEVSTHSEAAYRDLKYQMISDQNWLEEARFTKLELESNWKSLKLFSKNFTTKVVGYLYKVSNDFGGSIFLPILWLSILLIYGYLFYFYCGKVDVDLESQKGWVEELSALSKESQSFFYSIINTAGPLKLHPTAQKVGAGNIWTVVVSTIHSILSSYFWFLIIAWIRKRFRTH